LPPRRPGPRGLQAYQGVGRVRIAGRKGVARMTATSLPLPPDVLLAVSDRLPAAGALATIPVAVPSNGQPTTLAEVVDHEARAYRAWGTPAGDFLARQMERLAQLVRWTGAGTPEEHEARMEVWDDELRDQWFDRGYQEGVDDGRREAARRPT